MTDTPQQTGLPYDPTNAHPVNPTRFSRARNLPLATIGRAALASFTMVFLSMGVALVVGLLLQVLGVGGRPQLIGVHLGVFLASLPIVALLLRRKFEGDPASYLALGWQDGKAAKAFVLGLGCAVLTVGGAIAVALATGTHPLGQSPDLPSGPEFALWTIAVVTVSFCLQGFPEEIIWRGYLQTTLMARFSPVQAALISALVFALMHLTSPSSSGSPLDTVKYIVGIIGMGLVMAALRMVTGSTWGAIAYHTGYHLVNRSSDLYTDGFNPTLVTTVLQFTVFAALMVVWTRRRAVRTAGVGLTEPA